MAYEERPGDGVLFQNKEIKSDKSPSHTGYVIAHRDIKAGERVRLAGWRKGGEGGKATFLSLKMSDEREQQQPAPRQPEPDPF